MGKSVHANIISFGISLNLQRHNPKSKVKSMYLSYILYQIFKYISLTNLYQIIALLVLECLVAQLPILIRY